MIDDLVSEFHRLHSSTAELHLYGSVATGMARPSESDVDLLVIDGARDWAANVSALLSQRFTNLCRGVEIGAVRSSDYTEVGDEAYGNRVFLRHFCVPLAGPDAVRRKSRLPAKVGQRRVPAGGSACGECDDGAVTLEGWNTIPDGFGASFDVAAAPWWLRQWFQTPFVDRFAYPHLVRRGFGWLSPEPGATVDVAEAVRRHWRIRPDDYVSPASRATLGPFGRSRRLRRHRR